VAGISRFIALRYLVAKKSLSIITIMSLICMVVVAVVAMAMVVVLSAFNGIEALIDERFSYFDADISISPLSGKVISPADIDLEALRNLPEVASAGYVIEEFVLAEYERNQRIAVMKGVEPVFLAKAPIDSMIIDGDASLYLGTLPAALIGIGVKYDLNLRLFEQQFNPLRLSAIQRGKKLGSNPEQAFNKLNIPVSGVFSINIDFDSDYIIVPIEFAADLLKYNNEYSAIELYLQPGVKGEEVQEKIAAMLGPNFEVRTRLQKNELIYKTNKSEKWATFVIMGFIMLIATFNIIAALTLLINEKRRDIRVLYSLGATTNTIRRIFFTAGALINAIGAAAGLLLGFALVYLQKNIGLIRLEGGLVEYYPVEIQLTDMVAIFALVVICGFLSSVVPVQIFTRKYGTPMAGAKA
jgi:lipoprotein-releasing system permease protein